MCLMNNIWLHNYCFAYMWSINENCRNEQNIIILHHIAQMTSYSNCCILPVKRRWKDWPNFLRHTLFIYYEVYMTQLSVLYNWTFLRNQFFRNQQTFVDKIFAHFLTSGLDDVNWLEWINEWLRPHQFSQCIVLDYWWTFLAR